MKTLTKTATILALGIPLAGFAATPSVSCPSIGEKRDSYSLGRELAEQGYLNLAYFSMDRAARAKSSSTKTKANALACLGKIEAQNPILDLAGYRDALEAIRTSSASRSEERKAVETFAFRGLIQSLSKKADSATLSTYSAILKKSDTYRTAAKALLAIEELPSGSAKTAALIRATLGEIRMGRANPEVKSLAPMLRLALARNLYAAGSNPSAIEEYEKLFKIGQPMQDALIECAWAQLRAKNYSKSIGLGYELSTGKLADFFAPEALSIRAISFVENCRYAEARQAIEKFAGEYRPLEAWLKTAGSNSSLYEMAVARGEGALGSETVPEKVWSLWSGSDLFIASQRAIRNAFREEREAKGWISDHVEDPKMKADLLADAAMLPAIRSRAAARVESHLAGLNRGMLTRIAAESERLRFVSIEVNQSAGRDLVYRNANPGIEVVEKDLAKAEKKAKSHGGKLSWGKVAKDDRSAELWTDEIGAYEAQTLDRCKAKAKYQETRGITEAR